MFANKLENFRKRQMGFWLLFRECCGKCTGGGLVENILTDVTAVRREHPAGYYQPDITLERGDRPPVWLEFTDASPPSISKLAYCAVHGIDVFELVGHQRPVDSSVFKAHIAPRNCRQRQRQRLNGVWEHLRNLAPEEQLLGVREDFRSPERKQREFEEFQKRSEERRQAVAAGEVCCARCGKPFEMADGGYSISYLSTHRPDGGCAEVPFCGECSFAIFGGWDGVFPETPLCGDDSTKVVPSAKGSYSKWGRWTRLPNRAMWRCLNHTAPDGFGNRRSVRRSSSWEIGPSPRASFWRQ